MKETGPLAVPPEEQLLGRADPGQVQARARAALKNLPSRYQLRIESIESSTERMKQALTCCGDSACRR